MAGKGGGAWKVAYADFVTAMMAFFLVMWITSQNQDVREAIASHFQDPFAPVGFSEDKAQGAPRHTDQATPARAGKPSEQERRQARRPTFLLTGQGKTTSIGVVIFFDEGSVALDDAARRELEDLLPWLQGKPQKLEIRGHASRRPMPAGSPHRDSWELSYARCVAAMAHLEEHGIHPERIRLSQGGSFESFLEDGQPADPERRERVEIRLLNEVVQIVSPAAAGRLPASTRHVPPAKAVAPHPPAEKPAQPSPAHEAPTIGSLDAPGSQPVADQHAATERSAVEGLAAESAHAK